MTVLWYSSDKASPALEVSKKFEFDLSLFVNKGIKTVLLPESIIPQGNYAISEECIKFDISLVDKESTEGMSVAAVALEDLKRQSRKMSVDSSDSGSSGGLEMYSGSDIRNAIEHYVPAEGKGLGLDVQET